LAFLLGGSAAFGDYASSDATTIAGYLNRIQDQYFFVSAGVPSWNSTQEMFRLALQILDYRPALVMTYDGANDAEIMNGYHQTGHDYPAGTPDSFETLSAIVQDGNTPRLADGGELMAKLFPELAARIDARLNRGDRDDGAGAGASRLPEGALRAGAARYLSSLARMRDLATAGGARFIAVFQPVAPLHRNLGSARPFADDVEMERFHQAVIAGYASDFEFHDLGKVFDEYYAVVPVMNTDITDETVFVDEVHLYDPGNEIVARRLAALLK
jgi:hypothetical protein